LPLDVKLQVVLLGNRNGATRTVLERRSLREQKRIEVDRLVTGQPANFRLPSMPSQRLIEFPELGGHRPHEELGIPKITGFPAKRIRRVIVDFSFVLAECPPVESEGTSNRVIRYQIETMASALVPRRQRPSEAGIAASAKDAEPSGVQEQSCGLEHDRSHR